VNQLSSEFSVNKDENIEVIYKSQSENQKNLNAAQGNITCNNDATFDTCKESSLTRKKTLNIIEITQEINAKYIEMWYRNISNDRSFPDEAQDLLSKFLTRLVWKTSLLDKIKVTNKLANVLLLHLKEYHRYEYIHLKNYLCKSSKINYLFISVHIDISTEHYVELKRVLQLAWRKLINIYTLDLAVRRRWSTCYIV